MTQLISVGIGQCGVQMTSTFTEYYMKEAQTFPTSEACQRFFYETSNNKFIARTVLIDTESKVVDQIIQQSSGPSIWSYDKHSIWAQGSGARNNWAVGFTLEDSSIRNKVMERLQHQAEKCDRFGGFLMFQSLAGGTGSGLGSRITESVRDYFGVKAHLVNTVVWPYQAGEVMVQSYNSVLSLACLLKNSDAVCLTYNDVLHQICSKTNGEDSVNFQDMNIIIAKMLSGMVLPSRSVCTVPLWSQPLSHLASLPSRRLFSLFSLPIISENAKSFSMYNWESLINNVVSMTATGNYDGQNIASIQRLADPRSKPIKKCDSLWMVLRGAETKEGKLRANECNLFQSEKFFAKDNPDPLLVSSHPKHCFGFEKSVTIMANSQAIVDPLDDLLNKIHLMLESGAYLYQYIEAGVDKEWIDEDRLFLEQVLNEYKNM
uniref:Tubulin delta chain n=1 Tax=Trichonympha agilis TaxID=63628 RepID=R4WLX5_9EUKA|nr:delta-tubulin [Trichonympha agilis]